jgi:hypothetical protein
VLVLNPLVLPLLLHPSQLKGEIHSTSTPEYQGLIICIEVVIGRYCLNKVYIHDERVTAALQIVAFKRMTLADLDPDFLCSASINLVSNYLHYLLRE